MLKATEQGDAAVGEGTNRADLLALIEAEVEARVAERLAPVEARLAALEPRTVSNRVTLLVFSNDMDKVLTSLVIATGAAAMGFEVTVFHTFWGLAALRKGRRKLGGKKWMEKALSVALPAGLGGLSPSKLAFAGAGAKIFRSLMAAKGIQSPEDLFAMARETGVKFLACEMSMDVMGIGRDELVDGVEIAGVGAYLGDAADSKVTLFI